MSNPKQRVQIEEPWGSYDDEPHVLYDRDGDLIAKFEDDSGNPLGALAQRARVCVNAMAGVEDPEKFMVGFLALMAEIRKLGKAQEEARRKVAALLGRDEGGGRR